MVFNRGVTGGIFISAYCFTFLVGIKAGSAETKPAAEQPPYYDLVSGNPPFPTNASAISQDGTVAVGYYKKDGKSHAHLWTVSTDGTGNLPELPGTDSSQAFGVSANGSVVVGQYTTANRFQPFRWNAGSAAVEDLHMPAEVEGAIAMGVSADGSVAVGFAALSGGLRAVRWTDKLEELEPWAPESNSLALGVNTDGSVVVGEAFVGALPEAYRWTAKTGKMHALGFLPGGTTSVARRTNADGSVVIGQSDFNGTGVAGADNTNRAFRWTEANGVMQNLGVLPGGQNSGAKGVSADGSVVVGDSISASGVSAFRWTEATGMISVEDWLRNNGVAVASDFTASAEDVSANGNVIIGQTKAGTAYIARVVPTAAKFDGKSERTVQPSATDAKTPTPADDAKAQTPSDGLTVQSTANDGKAQAPVDDAKAQTTAGSDKAQTPSVDATAQTPADGLTVQSPANDGKAQAPVDDAKAQTPSDGAKAQTPADSDKSQTPSVDVTAQKPADDAKTQTPSDDTKTQAPAGDKGQTPSVEVTAQTPADDGKARTPSDDTRGQTPRDDAKTETPADDGKAVVPAPDGKTQRPADEATTQAPANGSQTQTPLNDGKAQPPATGAEAQSPAPEQAVTRSGIIDVAQYDRTLAARPTASIGIGYASTLLNGAHGEPMRNLLEPGRQSFGLVFDVGHDNGRGTKDSFGIADIGYGIGLEGGATARLAFGVIHNETDIDTGGSSIYRGSYIAPEISMPVAGNFFATLGAYYAPGEISVERGYLNGGMKDYSRGKADLETWAARLRFDWLNAATIGDWQLTPYGSLTYAQAKMDGYTESNGSFPAIFNVTRDHSTVLRAGLDGVTDLTDTIRLLARAEAAYRFEKEAASTSGSILGLYGFRFGGQEIDQFWIRGGVGAEFDIAGGTASLNVNVTTQGSDPTVWLRSGWKVSF